MSAETVVIHIDGAARGNPGPAAFAFVMTKPDGEVIEDSGLLGSTTNNIAEYTALLRVLEKAAALSLDRLLIHSDSELLVKQMGGEYRVKNADLRTLYDGAQSLLPRFKSVRIDHVRREQNKRADELCNLALDGGTPRAKSTAKKEPANRSLLSADAIRAECVACLSAVRGAWAENDVNAPNPEQVWEQLWSILEENGAFRKKSKG